MALGSSRAKKRSLAHLLLEPLLLHKPEFGNYSDMSLSLLVEELLNFYSCVRSSNITNARPPHPFGERLWQWNLDHCVKVGYLWVGGVIGNPNGLAHKSTKSRAEPKTCFPPASTWTCPHLTSGYALPHMAQHHCRACFQKQWLTIILAHGHFEKFQ